MRPWPLLLLLACGSCFDAPSADCAKEVLQPRLSNALATRPDGPIRDAADLIPAAEEMVLDKRLRDVFEAKRTALIVVTVSSLDGQDIDTFTNALARRWKVGGERGGVMLLVAPGERQVRIETSDDVRVRLTDQQCTDIIEDVLTPRFKVGDFAGGIAAGVDAIASHL